MSLVFSCKSNLFPYEFFRIDKESFWNGGNRKLSQRSSIPQLKFWNNCDLSNLTFWETEKTFPAFSFLVIATFCNGKLEGFYDDPSDCQAFFQCLNGKSTKRFCLKGMVFNPVLKTCDTPRNFACREHPTAPEVNNMTARHGRDQGRENGAEPSQLSSSISGKQCLNVFLFVFFFWSIYLFTKVKKC